jgi:WD40 repeat protein
MKKTYLFAIIFLFIVISCWEAKRDRLIDIPKTVNIDSSLTLQPLSILSCNLKLIGRISSFCFVDENNYVVTQINPPQVILYDKTGTQIREIGKSGSGPFEYISPAIVRSDNKNIYVWCNMQLKLIVFDTSGNPIKEFPKFERAIKDFVIYKNYVCFYSAGGFDEPIIKIYDLNTKKFIKQAFGVQSNEHKILSTMQGSGGLALSKNNLFFASIDELSVYKVDLDDFSISNYKINDPEFHVEKVNVDHHKFIGDPKSIQYIFGSDITTGLFCTNNYVALKVEIGKIEIKGMQADNSKRMQKNYIFDDKMNLKYAVRAKLNNGCDNFLYTSYGDFLYALKLREDNTYELNKVNLFRF